MNQAARRSFRIGQTEECRLYYLAYRDTFQESIAQLVAMKNKTAQALNGDVSTDGLPAMLGDEGNLQSMLIKSINSGKKLKGSTEEWVATTSDRARELLNGIGKKKEAVPVQEQFKTWVKRMVESQSSRNVLINNVERIVSSIEVGEVIGFRVKKGILQIDLSEAFCLDVVADGLIVAHLIKKTEKPATVSTSTKESSFEEVNLFEIKTE